MPSPFYRNHLLARLHSDDLERLRPHLSPVEFTARQVLAAADQGQERIWFPGNALISIMATAGHGRQSQVGLVGWDGMSACPAADKERAPFRVCVQSAGNGHAIGAEELRAAMAKSPTLCGMMQAYSTAFLAQVGFTALANSNGSIGERLARWLLMANDRLVGEGLNITHEALSDLLGVRRPGVTVALSGLASEGAIAAHRSHLEILDRAVLVERAGGLYGPAEAIQQRLTGWSPQHVALAAHLDQTAFAHAPF